MAILLITALTCFFLTGSKWWLWMVLILLILWMDRKV